MKKTSIAVLSVAALAAVAMPFGASAVSNRTTTATDTVTVTINSECALNAGTEDSGTSTVANSWTGTLNLGSTIELTGTTDNTGTGVIGVQCNNASQTWAVSIIGANTVGDKANELTSGENTISAGATALDGSVSEWAVKYAGEDVEDSAVSYFAVPADEAATIATGTGASTFAPTYKISVNDSQEAGTYTGVVEYTLTQM